jgi:hypothetical protein
MSPVAEHFLEITGHVCAEIVEQRREAVPTLL